MPSRESVKQLITLVEQGKYVEAIEQFYADDASMQENNHPPRKGLEALVKHERGMMASYRSIRTLPVETFLVNGDHVVIRWVFEFTRPDGKVLRMDELALQRWRGEQVVEERFFYDPRQMRG
jgi:ketosteroid isomerase-like protein